MFIKYNNISQFRIDQSRIGIIRALLVVWVFDRKIFHFDDYYCANWISVTFLSTYLKLTFSQLFQ